jgi:hypothetical protein
MQTVSQPFKRCDMMYLIGGAPRAGKTILGQRLCTALNIGWISTNLLMELLRVANAAGRKMKWDATPEAITANAQWFFPYLEHFIWGVSSFTCPARRTPSLQAGEEWPFLVWGRGTGAVALLLLPMLLPKRRLEPRLRHSGSPERDRSPPGTFL